jgi:hypothetical protein
MRLSPGHAENQSETGQKAAKIECRALHGIVLRKDEASPALSHDRVAA